MYADKVRNVQVCDSVDFDKVWFVLHKPMPVNGDAPIRRFEPVTVDMTRIDGLNGTGYLLYNGKFAYHGFMPERATLDVYAPGSEGTAEAKFI